MKTVIANRKNQANRRTSVLWFCLTWMVVLFVCSCTPTDETAKEMPDRFDPRIPAGIIGTDLLIKPPTKMTTLNSFSNTLRVSWKSPMGYDYVNFTVGLYRMECDFEVDQGCKLSDVYSETPGVIMVQNSKANMVDDANLVDGQIYSYFACTYLGDKQGPCKASKGTALNQLSENILPIPVDFWEKISMITGQSASGYGGAYAATLFTLDPGQSRFDTGTGKSKVTGKLVFAKNGAVAYLADTDNNRVIIYARGNGMCNREAMDDDAFNFCLQVQSSMPLQPINILGQPDQYSNKSCQDHDLAGTNYRGGKFVEHQGPLVDYRRCLTKPQSVTVDEIGNRLIIADTGNDRVLIYNGIPTDAGCDPSVNPMVSNKVFCDATTVIGKKSLYDLSAYSFASYGDRTLNNPIDVKVRYDDLYILDSGNHRLLKVGKYNQGLSFNCTETNWLTSFCRFTAVLGQRNLFSRESMSDLPSSGLFVGTPGNESAFVPQYKNFLKNHFGNPTSFRFTDDNKLIISAFENYTYVDGGYHNIVKGRLVVFDETAIAKEIPSCTTSNFDDEIFARCFAIAHLGIVNPEVLPRMGAGADYLLSVSYGMDYISDFDVTDQSLVAISPFNSALYVFGAYHNTTAYSRRIEDPSGQLSSKGTVMPDLKGTSSIVIEKASEKFYIVDPMDSKFYELNTNL
ncbi:hypothetical protein [Bdellovibrio sp. BCCA]|uniref:hypothetical protein n=1 Tax=Bdellovibrio sp. BCCA TaxID=3136281 RepID=UPI0030F07E25